MKKGCLALLIFILSGCSSKLAYNNLDWLIPWYLDDYIELNDSQENLFDKRLATWIHWHRSEELPKYVTHLKVVRDDIQNNAITETRLLAHYERATEHWHRLRVEVTPELATMAETLSEEQIIHLFAMLEKDNEESEEEISEYDALSERERADKRVEDLEDDISSRIGSLTDEQKAIIASAAPSFQRSGPLWLSYRRDLQSRARKLFSARTVNADFIQDLQTLMLNPEQYRSEAFLSAWKNNRQQHAKLASAIAKTLTERQKDKIIGEINDMINDLEDLLDD